MECLSCQAEISPTFRLHQWLSFEPLHVNYLCVQCEQTLKQCSWRETGCNLCSRTVSSEQEMCSDCSFWLDEDPTYPLQIDAIYHYEPAVKQLIHQYKTVGDIRAATIFEAPLKSMFKKKRAFHSIVIPIVSHPEREVWRGFNQITWLLDRIKVDYIDVFLYQDVATKKQAHQSRQERLVSHNPFYIRPELQETLEITLKGRHVCLVDDIYTTGKTLHHAMDCLKKFQVKSFSAITIAH